MKNVSNTNYGRLFELLGYTLYMNAPDARGMNRKYKLSPSSGSGPVSCFDSLSQLRDHHSNISLMRDMQELDDEGWSNRMLSWYASKLNATRKLTT